MSRITDRLALVKKQGKKGLIVYVTAGYPDYTTTIAAVEALEKAGADVIEIGMPFSDPMADGPVIQKAATTALANGATTEKTLECIRRIREKSQIPLAVMTYVNTVLNRGVEQFAHDFTAAGVDGLIVPDVPAEESEILFDPCRKAGLDLIQFAAPTTGKDRLPEICSRASGFIYCIATTGVTGVRQNDYTAIRQVIGEVRPLTGLPLAIGFGIGSPQSAVQAAENADAAIVGSAVVKLLAEQGTDAVGTFVGTLRSALDQMVSK